MAIAIFFLLVSISFAQIDMGGVPHQFYGKVTVNGKSAPNNLLIVAKINGVEVAATTTNNGGYGYSPNIFYVQDPDNNREGGKPIIFYVSGIQGGIHNFTNGASTQLDLAVTGTICGDTVCTSGESCSSCPADCGTCGGGGGGGGSGGSGGGSGGAPSAQEQNQTQGENNIPPAECTSDWQCTDWLDCSNGKQKRVCVDANKCGTEIRKDETRACENPADVQKSLATGSLLEDPTSLGAVLGAIAVIIIIVLYYFFKKRKIKIQTSPVETTPVVKGKK